MEEIMESLNSFAKTLTLFITLFFAGLSLAYAQNVRTLNIIGTNQMKFTVPQKESGVTVGKKVKGDNGKTQYILKKIEAKPGQKMKIILHNYSKLPASAMSHDWVLLKMNANPMKVANKSSQAREKGYIASSVENEIIAHSGIVSGGNSDSVTFTVPDKTGKYEFICTFPGHYAAGMKGKLVVTK
jgi:azurin